MTEQEARALLLKQYHKDENGNKVYYDIVHCDSEVYPDGYEFTCVEKGHLITEKGVKVYVFGVFEDDGVLLYPGYPMRRNN